MRKLDLHTAYRRLITCAALLAATAPAHALSSLILIQTARPPGPHRYSSALDYENVIFGKRDTRWLLKERIGIGKRTELGLNINPVPSTTTPLLWFGKYQFASIDKDKTAAAIGFRSFGANNKWSPYLVVSHFVEGADLHSGVIRTRSAIRYFVGADGPISRNVRWMADFTSGSKEFWSFGADMKAGKYWSGRIGRISDNPGNVSRLHIEVKYTGRY